MLGFCPNLELVPSQVSSSKFWTSPTNCSSLGQDGTTNLTMGSRWVTPHQNYLVCLLVLLLFQSAFNVSIACLHCGGFDGHFFSPREMGPQFG